MRVDKYGYNIPDSWDNNNNKENKMSVKKGIKNTEKQGIAAELIKIVKERNVEYSSADIAKVFSTAYTIARKAAYDSK